MAENYYQLMRGGGQENQHAKKAAMTIGVLHSRKRMGAPRKSLTQSLNFKTDAKIEDGKWDDFFEERGKRKEDDPDKVDTTLQTNTEGFSNLVNTCLDSAILTVAFGLDKCGLLFGLLVMIYSAIANRRAIILNLECCTATDTSQSSYTFAERAYGKVGTALFLVFNSLFPFLQMVSYVFAVNGIINAQAPQFADFCGPHLVKLLPWVFFVPMTYKRALPDLGLFSSMAFFSAAVVVLCVILQSLVNITTAGDTFVDADEILAFASITPKAQLQWPQFLTNVILPRSMWDFCLGFPVLALLFCGEYGAQVVLANLKDSTLANQKRVSSTAYAFLFVFYTLSGVFGVLQQRCITEANTVICEPIDGNITLSLHDGWFVPVAQVGVIVLVSVSYFIEALPLKFVLMEVFFGYDESIQEGSRFIFDCITTGINIGVLLVTFCLDDLEQVLALNAAICVSVVGFIYPPILFMKLVKEQSVIDLFRNYVSISAGIFLLVIGTYTNF